MTTVNQEIVEFNSLGADDQELIRAAVAVRQNAYVPYSKFQVGAALRCSDGTTYVGCNVENAAYGCSICAERSAIVKAVSEGKQSFTHLAVVGDVRDGYITPCGSCRQVVVEFGTNWVLYFAKPDLSTVLVTDANSILPLPFLPPALS